MAATMNAFIRKLGIRVVPLSRGQRFALYVGVGLGTLLLLWLDSPASPFSLHVRRELIAASVFQAIWTGIEILAGWVATAAEVTATYVWIALQWLGAAVGTFLKSTGAMFAKVWDGMKIVWSDVLKPALVWIDDHLKRLYTWLKDTFKPVFDFLREVRCRLHDFYTTFVRPVVDTIEFVRQINRVLLAFHVDLLQSLDKVLQQLEQRIEEPFLWVEKKLNEIWNTLELVVTLDGFFQRLTLLRSMQRYAPRWINHFWARQFDPTLRRGTDYDREREYPQHEVLEDVNALTDYFTDGGGDHSAVIAELSTMFVMAAQTVAHVGDAGA